MSVSVALSLLAVCLQRDVLRFPASGFPLKGGKAQCWEFTSFRRFTHIQINERARARERDLLFQEGIINQRAADM